jgi:hypothetical protein
VQKSVEFCLARFGQHGVVIVGPGSRTGLDFPVFSLADSLRQRFHHIQNVALVGTCSGTPNSPVGLGDVVVSTAVCVTKDGRTASRPLFPGPWASCVHELEQSAERELAAAVDPSIVQNAKLASALLPGVSFTRPQRAAVATVREDRVHLHFGSAAFVEGPVQRSEVDGLLNGIFKGWDVLCLDSVSTASDPSVRFEVIRGIVNHCEATGRGELLEAWGGYAALAAAACFRALLTKMPPADPAKAAGSSAASASAGKWSESSCVPSEGIELFRA